MSPLCFSRSAWLSLQDECRQLLTIVHLIARYLPKRFQTPFRLLGKVCDPRNILCEYANVDTVATIAE